MSIKLHDYFPNPEETFTYEEMESIFLEAIELGKAIERRENEEIEDITIRKYDEASLESENIQLPDNLFYPLTKETAFTIHKENDCIGLIHLSNSMITGELKENLEWLGLDTVETGIGIDTFEIFRDFQFRGYGKKAVESLFEYYPEATFITAYANDEVIEFWYNMPGFVYEKENEGYHYFYIYK